jgi:hypothetical protein
VEKKEASSGRLDIVFVKEAGCTAQEEGEEVAMAQRHRGRGGRVDQGKRLVVVSAHIGKDTGSHSILDAAYERRTKDVTAEGLAGGDATDEGM